MPLNFMNESKGINKTKNQFMLIEKLCQYLTLKQEHLDVIPEIQDGMCAAMAQPQHNPAYSQRSAINPWRVLALVSWRKSLLLFSL